MARGDERGEETLTRLETAPSFSSSCIITVCRLFPNPTDLCKIPENLFTKQATDTDPKFHAIKIMLVQTKDDSSILYAEVGQDFVDLAFGLLSTPLGTVLKTFSQLTLNGCMDSIYESVGGSVKQGRQDLLLSPKLAPFFGCSSNVLQDCRGLFVESRFCSELNPKSSTDGAYVKGGPMNFMVTNELHIVPFSLTNTLEFLRASKIPKEKLVEKELTLNKTQVFFAILVNQAFFRGY